MIVSYSLILFIRLNLIEETSPFRHHGKQCGRSSAGLVHTPFPFGDGLLSGAQLGGHLILGQAQVLAQGMDALAIPHYPTLWLFHDATLHDLV